MSICTGIGNGIGGILGKLPAGLGSALGLGAVVDASVRAYTGYGLLDTLSVPYIECPDGSFASAVEWYGSGLKCPQKKENTPLPTVPNNSNAQKNAASSYAAMIAALGGVTVTYFGYHAYGFQQYGTMGGAWGENREGHFDYDANSSGSDKLGNRLTSGLITESNDGQATYGGIFLDPSFTTVRDGALGSYAYTNRRYPTSIRTEDLLADFNWFAGSASAPGARPWAYLGTLASIPDKYEKAPPAIRMPKKGGFTPPKKRQKEDCEMTGCPCLTPADIERAVKKALGLTPFAPEKLVRELGAKMYAAPGPSVIPVVPANLVEAIAAIAATNYMRAGYGRYPVLMPKSLVNDDSIGDAIPAQPFENFAEWFEWLIKQQDAIQGEWPVELAIVDGAKRQPLKFENISEAFAELTGLMIQTATDADAAVAVSAHAAVAATKAQAAAVIAQKNAECIIKFFGIRTGYSSVFVETVITPMDTDSSTFNLKKFLTPSRQAVIVYTDNDPFDFQPVLDRILRNTEIAKSAVALDAKGGLVGDFTRNQRKYDESESKRVAEKELEKLETSLKAQNPDFTLKIKVDTVTPNDDVLGDKFVIKRPKTTNE